jgi:hypothetical protein
VSQFKTPEFNTLKKEWYKKLKDKGFKDIEQDEDTLNFWAGTRVAFNYTAEEFDYKQTYYRYAGMFLNDHKFDNKMEKLIWEQHASGVSIRNIVKLLKKKRYLVYRSKVHLIVKKLRDLMLAQHRQANDD